jgi:hypothetical protein
VILDNSKSNTVFSVRELYRSERGDISCKTAPAVNASKAHSPSILGHENNEYIRFSLLQPDWSVAQEKGAHVALTRKYFNGNPYLV